MNDQMRFLVKDNRVSISIPIVKSNIDQERRIVSGWATLDNLDQGGDVVTADASLRAFASFRGNVREQHDEKKAVGRVVDFRQQEYFTADGESHTGIWVDVYVSKGAEDTWQKVLDGTLSGFSIGGRYSDQAVIREYIPDLNAIAKIIIDYSLIELSLVDNPGNELCDIVDIQKRNDVAMENSVDIQNVFWCPEDEVAICASQELIKCNTCGNDMNSLGWFEAVDDSSAGEQIKKILESNVTKGGSETMSEEVVVPVEEAVAAVEDAVETPVAEEVAVVEDAVAEVAPEVAAVTEPDLAVVATALEQIQASLARTNESEKEREVALTKVREVVEGVEAKVTGRLDSLLEEHTKLVEDFNSFKQGLNGIEKRLADVEGTTAFQKSLNVEGVATPEVRNTGGFWSGSFIDD